MNIRLLAVTIGLLATINSFGMQFESKKQAEKYVKQRVKDGAFKLDCKEFGDADVSLQTRENVYEALRLMGKKNPEKVQIRRLERNSKSEHGDMAGLAKFSGIWLKDTQEPYRVKFNAYHEAGYKVMKHISYDWAKLVAIKNGQIQVSDDLKSCKKRILTERQEEQEADGAAINALLLSGDGDTVARKYLHVYLYRPILKRMDDGISYPDNFERAVSMKKSIITGLQAYQIEPRKLNF